MGLDDIITIGPKELVFSRFLMGDIIILKLSNVKRYYFAQIKEPFSETFDPMPGLENLVLPKKEEVKSYYDKILDTPKDAELVYDFDLDSAVIWHCSLNTFKELYSNWEKGNK